MCRGVSDGPTNWLDTQLDQKPSETREGRERKRGAVFLFLSFVSRRYISLSLCSSSSSSSSASIVALLFSFFSPISSPRNRQAATADREEERPLLRSPKKEIASGLVRSSESASIWGRAGKLALLIQSFLAVDFGYEVILFAWTGDGSLVVLEKSVTAERYNFRFPV
ncbi:hypothetical protein BHE74_00048185 [Ensete ventricosum]|nr:hypothetical protein BHE74_00048185 [Ensete ventricosum]